MSTTEIVLWGCLGGVLPDVLRLIGERYKGAPLYLKQWFFWFSLLLLVGVAGLATWLLAPSRIVDAVAIGFSAPEMLSNALGARKPRPITRTASRHRTTDSMTHYHRGAGEYDGETVQEWAKMRIAQLRMWWAK
jgi:hypothetical protein